MSPRARFAAALFDRLWKVYRARVPHARTYERLVTASGASFVNDHVAFRTLALQGPQAGIASVSRLFEALGYAPAGCYAFPDKGLSAVHLAPPDPALPKVFVSELKTWELSPAGRRLIARNASRRRPDLSEDALAALRRLEGPSPRLLAAALRYVHELPWAPPEGRDVEALDRESQFGAWVLCHGYEANHFTALVNSHGPGPLSDIEKTVAALRAAGVPMKAEIEGARGSKLRQSATAAARTAVRVRRGSRPALLDWTYAYFELAERGLAPGPERARPVRFEGFLGGQAAQLFEMTRR